MYSLRYVMCSNRKCIFTGWVNCKGEMSSLNKHNLQIESPFFLLSSFRNLDSRRWRWCHHCSGEENFIETSDSWVGKNAFPRHMVILLQEEERRGRGVKWWELPEKWQAAINRVMVALDFYVIVRKRKNRTRVSSQTPTPNERSLQRFLTQSSSDHASHFRLLLPLIPLLYDIATSWMTFCFIFRKIILGHVIIFSYSTSFFVSSHSVLSLVSSSTQWFTYTFHLLSPVPIIRFLENDTKVKGMAITDSE